MPKFPKSPFVAFYEFWEVTTEKGRALAIKSAVRQGDHSLAKTLEKLTMPTQPFAAFLRL